jgi:hypothetical protein
VKVHTYNNNNTHFNTIRVVVKPLSSALGLSLSRLEVDVVETLPLLLLCLLLFISSTLGGWRLGWGGTTHPVRGRGYLESLGCQVGASPSHSPADTAPSSLSHP